MALQIDREVEELALVERIAGQRVRGDEPGDRRRRRRAEAAQERDVVAHPDLPTVPLRHLAERPAPARLERDDEAVVRTVRQLGAAFPLDLDAQPGRVAHGELDPVHEVDSKSQGVVAGAEVGAAGGSLDDDAPAHETAHRRAGWLALTSPGPGGRPP